jgi:hypothetical protein
MGNTEGRASVLRQLVDERQFLTRVLFWSFVLGVWTLLRSRWLLKGWRHRYRS